MDRPPREHILNAEPADQQRLLDLQDKDTRLAQLAHRLATIPEAKAMAELDTRLARLRDEIVAAQTIVGDLDDDLARAEADVEQVRERERRDQHLLNSGSISDPKQLQNLQHELESLARRKGELEDAELALMERSEGAQAAVAQLSAEREARDVERADLAQTIAATTDEVAAERASVETERAAIAASIPADLLALYERVRAEHNGVGAAHLHRGRCEGCRLQLTPIDIERLRAAPPTEVVRCEECRRILVRTAESGL